MAASPMDPHLHSAGPSSQHHRRDTTHRIVGTRPTISAATARRNRVILLLDIRAPGATRLEQAYKRLHRPLVVRKPNM